jgi:hypothetical protein
VAGSAERYARLDRIAWVGRWGHLSMVRLCGRGLAHRAHTDAPDDEASAVRSGAGAHTWPSALRGVTARPGVRGSLLSHFWRGVRTVQADTPRLME